MQTLPSEGFFYLRPDYATGCGDTGYYLGYRGGRDGDTLVIGHDTKPISNGSADPYSRILCFCSRSSRPLNDEERQDADDVSENVTLVAVSGGTSADAMIEGLWNARDFLTKYFEFNENSYIRPDQAGNKRKRVLVEVAFGTAWYGVNH